MKWKNIPTWLKGGIIGVIVLVLFVLVMLILMFLSDSILFPLAIFLPRNFLVAYVAGLIGIEFSSYLAMNLIALFVYIAAFFIIGSLIGLIIQKIKRK